MGADVVVSQAQSPHVASQGWTVESVAFKYFPATAAVQLAKVLAVQVLQPVKHAVKGEAAAAFRVTNSS
jgi:hypothetical protein